MGQNSARCESEGIERVRAIHRHDAVAHHHILAVVAGVERADARVRGEHNRRGGRDGDYREAKQEKDAQGERKSFHGIREVCF